MSSGRPALPGDARRLVGLMVAAAVLAVTALFSVAARPAAASDPVIAAAGDYGCDPLDPHYNNGDGTIAPDYCQQKRTSDQLVAGNYDAVLALGDQHYCGSLAEYQQAYEPTWGRVKSITHPIPGNHEYLTAGGSTPTTGCDETNAGAAGYFGYFGGQAGTPGQGWYSYEIGAWHLIALNSQCGAIGGCGSGSAQATWLANDLAQHPGQCLLAYWHVPLFSSGGRASSQTQYLWQLLYNAHADLVLSGHDHIYERFDPQDAAGNADWNGIREFIVGTGGANHTTVSGLAMNSVVRDGTSFGILSLSLHAHSYTWTFLPSLGSFTDGGSANCHSNPTPTPPPTPTPTPTPMPTSGEATFAAAADSYVDASQPAVNFGSASTLRADGSPVLRSFLKFNIDGVGGRVATASLRLYANSTHGAGFDVYSVPDCSWTEAGINNATAPPFGAKLAGSGALVAGAWLSLPAASAVTGNGSVCFGISTTSATALSLSSRSGTNPPQLFLSWEPAPPTPTPTPGPSLDPTPTPTVPPTPTPSPGPTASAVNVADSYVDASAPTANYGTATSLRVDASPLIRSYLRFDVTGVTCPTPTATLRVYANSSQSTGYGVFRVADTTWSESGITSATAPPFGALLGMSGRVNSATWTSVNVTGSITGDGPVAFGLSTTSATNLSLGSREGAHPPLLTVSCS